MPKSFALAMFAIVVLIVGVAYAQSTRDVYLNPTPDGFSDLQQAIPGIKLDIRYHTTNNFTGAPLPGYGAAGAWLRSDAAEALKTVQQSLAEKGLGLMIFDAYRPKRATLGMAAWATRTGQKHLFKQGYIAYRSFHNTGAAVDLTLLDLKTQKPLDMGSPFDAFSDKSHTKNATGKALENRLILKAAMEKAGFRPYSKEWWHFSYPVKNKEPRDVPYGCFETPEGKWAAPEGWDKTGYKPPMTWSPKPCAAGH